MRNARLALAVTLLSGGLPIAAPALAQTGDAARLQAVTACGSIAKKAKRLACYDEATRPTEAAAASATAPAAPAITPTQAFGLETVKEKLQPRNQPRKLDEIDAQVAAVSDNGIGHWLITMEDGARWRMTESERNFTPPRPGEAIRIRRASLGSYLMYVHHQPSVRVMRVE